VQNDVLSKLRDRDVVVSVVWLNMVRTDARDLWPNDAIVDPRATHYWDASRAVGEALAARDDLRGWRPVAWDVWALFPPGAQWNATPPQPTASGRTIIRTRHQLYDAVAALPPTPPGQ
jgi:hypothetical protein